MPKSRFGLVCSLFLIFAACSQRAEEECVTNCDEAPGTGTGGSTGGFAMSSGGGVQLGSGGTDETAGVGGGLAATGGATATGGAAEMPEPSSGGQSGLVLEGAPPADAAYPAIAAHWQLLPDDAEFTSFAGEEPFFIAPLRSENFPADFDYCTAPGGDAELNQKQQFARAVLKAELKTWYYDVTLNSVPEEDGETPYQLLINGEVVREFTTPPTGTLGAEDRKLFAHVWEHVPIEEGSEVEVRARAQSNLLIVEGAACRTGAGFNDTYAWARGRFDGLVLKASALSLQ